jgi:hypothetical protein
MLLLLLLLLRLLPFSGRDTLPVYSSWCLLTRTGTDGRGQLCSRWPLGLTSNEDFTKLCSTNSSRLVRGEARNWPCSVFGTLNLGGILGKLDSWF